jgi:hypothetical protein
MHVHYQDPGNVLLLKPEMEFVLEKFEQDSHRRPFHIPSAQHIDKAVLSQMQYEEESPEGDLPTLQFANVGVSGRN